MKFFKGLLLFVTPALGVVSYFLILNIIFSTGDGMFTQHNPKLTVLSILSLLIIIGGFSTLVIGLSKKRRNIKFIFIIIVLYFLFLFGTPFFQEYQLKFSNYLKTPTLETEQGLIKSIGLQLKLNLVPYIIDSDESIERTREQIIRSVLTLNKVVEGSIKKDEVNLIIELAPKTELRLDVYNKKRLSMFQL